jgi:hypothetical protein
MLNADPGPEREQLGFRDAVLSSFGFLRSYGLSPVEEKSTFVRYESQVVFVNVYHGRASYELGVEIGRLSEPKDKVTLHEIIAWAGTEQTEGLGQHTAFQVSSREGVKQFVPQLAELVKKYADPFLHGEAVAYESVKALRSERTSDYVKQVRFRDTRKKVEAAWQQKDYAQVVELLASIREDLSQSEVMKLAYAEKQILLPANGSRTSARSDKK